MMELPELKGYLRKKSRQDRWQRRYFEATTHYLTYYKVKWKAGAVSANAPEQLADTGRDGLRNRESEKLLACIDLWRTQNIALNANDPDRCEFSIAIGDQSYVLKAESADEAQKWIKGLTARQHRPEGAPSEVFSLRSERYDGESDASSEYGGRRPGYAGSDAGRRSGYAGSDTGSVGSTTRSSLHQLPAHTDFTDSNENPIVPNANAINAAGNSKYPMLKTDQTIPLASTYRAAKSHKTEDDVDHSCCAPCKTM